MPLDFPNSPTNGQIFTAGGVSWQFNGTSWVSVSGMLSLPDAPGDGATYGRRNAAWNSVDAMLAPVAANANAALNDTGRNLIHNGQFNVQQRGTGAWTTSSAYTADRWLMQLANDTLSVSLISLADADRTAIGDESAKFAFQAVFAGSATANSYNDVGQSVEDVRRLGGKTITVSFWARATSGTPRIGVAAQQLFGTGGSPSAQVINTVGATAALSVTWTRYSLTASVASTAGKTLGTNGDDKTAISFWLSDTSNIVGTGIGVQSGTIQLWGVQLEIGSVATPLAKRDPADELALCQRFYQVGNFYGIGNSYTAGGYLGGSVTWPVQMRGTPTVALQSPTYANTSGGTVDTVSAIAARFWATAAAAGTTQFSTAYTASADL